jgi:hypothetical protein
MYIFELLCLSKIEMSSVLREFAVSGKDGKFDNISTPLYYDDTLNNYIPIPFTIINGVLDIASTNSSVQDFINNGNDPDDEEDVRYQAKQMGGRRLVTSIGPNFDTYLRRRIQNIDSLGSLYSGELTIFVNAVMTKIQLAQPGQVGGLAFENVYGVNDYPPTSDEYIGGTASNKYFTSWVFYKPLTIRFVSSDSVTGYKYMTFSTHYDGD